MKAIEAGEFNFDGPVTYQIAAKNAAALRAQQLEKELRNLPDVSSNSDTSTKSDGTGSTEFADARAEEPGSKSPENEAPAAAPTAAPAAAPTAAAGRSQVIRTVHNRQMVR